MVVLERNRRRSSVVEGRRRGGRFGQSAVEHGRRRRRWGMAAGFSGLVELAAIVTTQKTDLRIQFVRIERDEWLRRRER